MRLYGLIGYPLHHSFSKKYFTDKFLSEGVSNANFENFEITSIDLLPKIFSLENLWGLAVTIPYKEAVLPYLDELNPDAASIQACNCIQFSDGKRNGFNTDYIGFIHSFQTLLQLHHSHALVLGTGGSSKAVQYGLKKLGIEYKTVSRKANGQSVSYDAIDESMLETFKVIINCTPLGTFPNDDQAPMLPYHFLTEQHYLYDLVYNPKVTKFLQLGKQQGAAIKNGYDMLRLQAEENWRIWNSV